MNPEELLLESLQDLERIVAFVCRRSAMSSPDVEDFGSFVKLKLIENDYAVLRKFEARSTLRSYLSIVVQRLLMDYRNHQYGKWRPSAEAKRLGATAVQLETLLHRDRRTIDEAFAAMQAREPALTRAELDALRGRLPERAPRRRDVALDELPGEPSIPVEQAERDAAAHESAELASRAGAAIRFAIDRLPEEDRLVLRMRFEAGMSVVEIARANRTEAAALYRRIYRSLDALRAQLEAAGVTPADAVQIIDTRDPLDFGLATPPPREPDDEETRR